MKNTIKLFAFVAVGFAATALSAQQINRNPLSPNANKAADKSKSVENVQVDPSKSVGQGSTNTNLTQPDKNAGSVNKPQTLNANSSSNTSLINPKSSGVGQPQTLNANSNTNGAKVDNVSNPGQSSNLNNNVSNPKSSPALKLKPSKAVKTQNAGAAQQTTNTNGN
jgi:hypothetical protein